jgi:hypothetical protein
MIRNKNRFRVPGSGFHVRVRRSSAWLQVPGAMFCVPAYELGTCDSEPSTGNREQEPGTRNPEPGTVLGCEMS